MQMRHQIVGERTFFRDVAHEHRDRAADGLIDINDENFVVVPEENRAAAARRQDCPHLHLDHRFVHRANSIRANRKNKRVRRDARSSHHVRLYASDEDFRASGLACSAR